MADCSSAEVLDAVVVGSGPVGLETAAGLAAAGWRVRVLEAQMLASSIFHWPPGTRFISSPERVAIAGVPVQTPLQEPMTRESYLAYLRAVVEVHRLDLWCHAPVRAIERRSDAFVAETAGRHPGRHPARRVVVATGRLSTPARLDVLGAERSHVHHRMRDPHVYFGQRVVVVGDGNGALDAAARLWRGGAGVVIAHRGSSLADGQVRPELLADVEMLIEKGCIAAQSGREVVAIDDHAVRLRSTGSAEPVEEVIPADFVVAEIGFEPDRDLLSSSGVRFGEDGVPEHDPATMETNVPGIFVVGTVIAPSNEATAISHAHDHVVRLVRELTGSTPPVGGAPTRRYRFSFGDDEP